MIIRGKKVLTHAQTRPIVALAKQYQAARDRHLKLSKALEKEIRKISTSIVALIQWTKIESDKYEFDAPIQKMLTAMRTIIDGPHDDDAVDKFLKNYLKALDLLSKASAAAVKSKRKKKAPAAEATEASTSEFSGAHQTIEAPPEPAEVTAGDDGLEESGDAADPF